MQMPSNSLAVDRRLADTLGIGLSLSRKESRKMSFCPQCETVNGLHETGCELSSVRPEWFDLIDDGSLDTVFECGNREFRFGDTSEYRDSETGELDLTAFFRNHIDELWDQLRWEIESEIERQIESYVEYETEHDDAGSNYAHCFEEDRILWQSKLETYVVENFDELPSDWKDRIKNIEFEIRSGHIFSRNDFADGFGIGGFPVGEVELQSNVDNSEFPADAVRAYLESQNVKVDRHGDYFQYANTDAVWLGVVTDEMIDDCLAD